LNYFMRSFFSRLTSFILLTLLLIALAGAASAQSPYQAGLVIQSGSGQISTYCVSFDQPTISGYELLQRSGVQMISSFSSMGAAICQINGEGCPADNCFCKHPPYYWSYWHNDAGSWMYSSLGASNTKVENGSVEAWVWGEGNPPNQNFTFEQICQAPTATATLPEPTATPFPPTAAPPEPTQEPTVTPEVPTEATGGAQVVVILPNDSTSVTPETDLAAAPPTVENNVQATPEQVSFTATITPLSTVTPRATQTPAASLTPTPVQSAENETRLGSPYWVFGVLIGGLIAVGIFLRMKRRP
jgi:hypothetical protein